MQIDPEYRRRLPQPGFGCRDQGNHALSPPKEDGLERHRAAGVRRLATPLSLVLMHADDLADQIKELGAMRFTALTRLCGISLLTAGTLAGILGPGRRFRTDAQLAAYASAVP